MKKTQTARVANAKKLLDLMNEHKTQWSSRKFIVAKVERIRTLVATVDANEIKHENTNPKGFATRKKEAFTQLRTVTFKAGVKLNDLATEIHNSVLLEAVNFTLSNLEKKTVDQQLAIARLVLGKAKEMIGQLSDYELGAADLNNFEARLTAAEALNTGLSTVRASHRAFGEEIAANCKDLMLATKGLDNLVKGFDTDNDSALFISAYGNVRKAVGRRGKTQKAPDAGIQKQEVATT